MVKAVQKINPFKPRSQPSRGCFHPGHSAIAGEGMQFSKDTITGKEMIGAMLKYIWPADDPLTRNRVKVALGLLIGAKMLNVCVPFLFKYSVDYLNSANTLSMASPPETVLTVATSLLLGCKY